MILAGEGKRAKLFASKETVACASLPTLEDEDELMAWLAEQDDDTIALGVASGVTSFCLECAE